MGKAERGGGGGVESFVAVVLLDAEVPLAEEPSGIVLFFKSLWEVAKFGWKGLSVGWFGNGSEGVAVSWYDVPEASGCGMQAGQEGPARRRALRGGVEGFEFRACCREGVDVWRFQVFATVAAECLDSKIVHEDDKNVGQCVGVVRPCREKDRHESEGDANHLWSFGRCAGMRQG